MLVSPVFHRAGSRKEWHLSELVKDAEIFAPMVPLLESTRGIVYCRAYQRAAERLSSDSGNACKDLRYGGSAKAGSC